MLPDGESEAVAPEPSFALRAVGIEVRGSAGPLVRGVDLSLERGTTTAIVGESGSGKSLTARSLVGLLPEGLSGTGELHVGGRTYDLTAHGQQTSAAWREIRGRTITLLLQDPFTSLSPVHRVASQVREALRTAGHRVTGALLEQRLAEVGLEPRVLKQYPHELSGGMRQRIALVLALAADPDVLIADEPTTALDSLTQIEILRLLDRLKRSREMSVLLISHDLEVVAGHADRIAVMQEGEVVESGRANTVLHSPSHPYTQALLAAVPSGRSSRLPAPEADSVEPVLQVEELRIDRGGREVLHGVSLEVRRGEILGLVGQSGSGKTTLARCIAGLDRPGSGTMRFSGSDRVGSRAEPQGRVQVVFQDPAGTLNPALTVRKTLAEAIRGARGSGHTPESLVALVGLPLGLLSRRPAALSGGQRQRVAIARALASSPELLICDEPVSALDVSVQAQILALLERLRDDHGQTMLFISHDLAVIARLSDRIVVMNEGQIVERGDAAQVLDRPRDPYTRRLLEASRGGGSGLPGI